MVADGDGEVAVGQLTDPGVGLRGDNMAAMKPRTGDGPLEVTKEGRGIVMRVPLEGGGRLVVEMTPDEATALGDAGIEPVDVTLRRPTLDEVFLHLTGGAESTTAHAGASA